MLKEGMFIQERYEIISRIGSGGMADVYKAKDHKLNRFVAVKVLKNEFRDDKVFISKFRTEAQSAAGLAHPNIVNVYDVGEDHGVYFIVMELVEGITLKEYIEKKGRLGVREATSIAVQVSMGLETAHNKGIIHRDVKPQNIIISTDGKVKVTDFGIARAASTNTISSNVMGSVHYSSPEQARGGYSDAKSDIYSLGITMYEMLTGHLPFDGDSTVAIAIKHLQEEMQSPRKYVPDLPKSIVQIIYKCTQKSADRRYSNMEELIYDLKESLVNPDGDFVQIVPIGSNAQTVVISKDELDRINGGYGDPGADDYEYGDGNYGDNYQDGYNDQDGYGGGYGGQYDDGYDDQGGYGQGYDDYGQDGYGNDGYGGGGYQNNPYGAYPPRDNRQGRYYDPDDDDDESGMHPKLEKVLTVGSIVIAVIIFCIFVALVVNALGFKINPFAKKAETETTTETETDRESESKKESETSKTEAGDITVPSLLGKTKAQAEEATKSLELGSKYGGEKTSNEYPAGQIMEQSPAAGTKVAKNTTIIYYVSKGAGEISIPDLSGYDLSSAQSALSALGLKTNTDYAYSDTVSQDLVIRTNPAAGASAQAGDTVTVILSRGPNPETQPQTQPANTVNVPDMTGWAQSDAQSAIQNLGLTVNIQEDVSTTVAKGLVMGQSASGSVEAGGSITLVISLGQPDPEVGGGNEGGNEGNGGEGGNGVYTAGGNLETPPTGYDGYSPVRISLRRNDVEESVITDGVAVSFPYPVQLTSSISGSAVIRVEINGTITDYPINFE